jgi:hypothetical protein
MAEKRRLSTTFELTLLWITLIECLMTPITGNWMLTSMCKWILTQETLLKKKIKTLHST